VYRNAELSKGDDAVEIAIVVPCYNEEAVLPETNRRLLALVTRLVAEGRIRATSYVLYVDDGSSDSTWALIEEYADQDTNVRGIKLSRNRGHQNALLAGLLTSDADAVISVDADLQDDLEAIPEMIKAYAEGFDVVFGVRKQRVTDTFLKRFTAESYYRLLDRMGVEIVFNHADYRLLSRRVVEALAQHDESNLFLRGIVPQLGYPSTSVYYDRAERFAGESKYPLRKMLAFAWEGISSFSAMPLRIITWFGMLISLGSFTVGFWALFIKLFSDMAVPGWASTVIPIYMLGGVQLLAIGVIGEYLAKIYVETKRRPKYFIERDTRWEQAARSGQLLERREHV